MTLATIVGLGILALPLVLLWLAVTVVPAAHVALVERLGLYRRSLSAGVHLRVPIVDAVKAIVDLRAQRLHGTDLRVVRADGRVVAVDVTVDYRVVHAVEATYRGAGAAGTLEQLLLDALRRLGTGPSGTIDAGRLAVDLRADLQAGASPGWRIDHVEVGTIRSVQADTPPQQLRHAPIAVDAPSAPAEADDRGRDGPFL